MCEEEWWGAVKVEFVIPPKMQNGTDATPAEVKITPESSATDTLGKHVITVGAYNSKVGTGGDPARHPIAGFSSRGPLRDFSSPAKGVIAVKPDIAAPGVDIHSAQSTDIDVREKKFTAEALRGIRFSKKAGTSMAAPFIAGVIALMLDKKPALTTADVRIALSTGAALRPGGDPAPAAPEYAGAFGSGMVDGLKSHKSA
jgi:subtilisin family serine protease